MYSQFAMQFATARGPAALAAGGVAGERLERDDDLEGQDDRPEEDEDQTRATWEMDRTVATGTVTVAMTATAADRMAVDPISTAKATTVCGDGGSHG